MELSIQLTQLGMKTIGASILAFGLLSVVAVPSWAQTVNAKPQQQSTTTQPATDQKQPAMPAVKQPATGAQPATQAPAANAVAAQPAPKAASEDPIDQGFDALRDGQLDEAKAIFDKEVAADKKDYLGMVGQGSVALLKGDVNAAKETFATVEKKAKKKNPDWLYHMAEAYTLTENKQYADEALRLINMVLENEKAEKKAEYYLVKGDAFWLKNQGGDAVSAYEAALQLQPQNPYALTQIGRIFKASKNYNNARDYFVKAIGLDSTKADAYYELGDLYTMGRNYRSAAFNYKKAIDNSANVPDSTLLNYTKMAFLAEDYKNMMTYLDKIKNKDAIVNTNPVRRMYAYAYVTEDYKQYDKALELMKQVLENNDVKKDSLVRTLDYAAIGQAYANLEGPGYDSLAIDYLSKASDEDTAKTFYGDVANLYYTKKKDYANAAYAYEKLNNWKEKHNQKVASQDYFNLGRSAYFGFTINKDSTLITKADSAFAKLAEVNPTYGGAYLWRARANRYMPDSMANDRAVGYYKTLVNFADTVSASSPNKITPKDLAEAHSFIGYSYYNQKDVDNAMVSLNKAMELDPTNKMATQLIDNINKSKTVANSGKKAPATKRTAPAKAGKPKAGNDDSPGGGR